MENRNPYAAPRTNVARAEPEPVAFGEIRVFSPSGRLGRLRYVGYSAGLGILTLLAVGVLAGLVSVVSPDAGLVVAGLGYVAIIAVQVVLTIQRAHDMNSSGWLSVLVFVPLAAFVFWFVPGTKGENSYGKPPPPNTAGVIVLACILPLVAVLGILAAIAIPAYQDYTIRAQVSEGLNVAAGAKAAVADAFGRTGMAPADRVAAGLSADARDSAGRYVAGMEVANGTILVGYGESANATIAGATLALQPFVMPNGELVWRCGFAAAPSGGAPVHAEAVDSAAATDIGPQHLPSACRP